LTTKTQRTQNKIIVDQGNVVNHKPKAHLFHWRVYRKYERDERRILWVERNAHIGLVGWF